MGNSDLSQDTQTNILNAFFRALTRETHMLTLHPDLLWQQLYNRLQWEGEEVKQVLASEVSKHIKVGARPWLHQMNRLAESNPLVRTIIGLQGEVNSCLCIPGEKLIVSAGADGSLRVWDRDTGECVSILGEQMSDVMCCSVNTDGT